MLVAVAAGVPHVVQRNHHLVRVGVLVELHHAGTTEDQRTFRWRAAEGGVRVARQHAPVYRVLLGPAHSAGVEGKGK